MYVLEIGKTSNSKEKIDNDKIKQLTGKEIQNILKYKKNKLNT